MKKLTKEDISQEVFDLYDDYAHNKIERRQFVEKLPTPQSVSKNCSPICLQEALHKCL